MQINLAYYVSPIGLIEITGNEEGISSLYFIDDKKIKTENNHESLKEAVYQLEEYFTGIRHDFGLKLNPQGSEFQKRVWHKLLGVPFGRTATYLDISRAIGDPNASRAVGAANGANPISIIIPCHRIIGGSGKLIGYSGGIKRKEWLLNHEKTIIFGKQTDLFKD